jgi:isopenicillin-N epimerase
MDATQATGNPERSADAPAPARFGRGMLDRWGLDPTITYLNHGTVGAPPLRVLEAQRRIRDEIELQPSRFLLRELTAIRNGASAWPVPRMRVAAGAVAEFLGSRGDDLVFVDNATTGVNAVLRSFDFRAGDEILVTDLVYGAVHNAARYVARERGATVRSIELPYPPTPEAVVATITGAIGPRTRVAVVEHVTPESAQLLPLAEITAACRARGVAVLVDGAHAPGAIALDISSYGVDWYVGNLHKWAFAPRSCGILWARPERQAGLHPTVISWGLDQGFTTEFDLVGTRDPSPQLTAPEGIAFLRELGVEAVQRWNHRLAWDAAQMLSHRWGTRFEVPESMIGTMATIPLPERAGSSREQAVQLRDALLFEDRIEVQLHAWKGRLWTRVSGQVYLDRDDIERLGQAVEQRM